MSQQLYLLDAFALIFRAHFAFSKSPRINSKGINTSVPFGFANSLLEIIQKQKPSHIAVAFDTSAPTFREAMYAEYKAHRDQTPEDIIAGTPWVKKILGAFGIPVLAVDGYEADDVIGTAALQAAGQGLDVYMVTSDKDFGQLVNDKIFLYKPALFGNAVEIMGAKEVCARWDIARVEQVIDILGLQGDAADNIPGVPGVGPKTAAELLKEYHSVENIIANAASLKGKLKEKFAQYADQALLSKKLAAINTNVPLGFSVSDFAYAGPTEEALLPIFEELEFRSLAQRVFSHKTPPTKAVKGAAKIPTAVEQLSIFSAETLAKPIDCQEAKTDAEILSLLEAISAATSFAFALSTDSGSYFEAKPKGIALSWKNHPPVYAHLNESNISLFKNLFAREDILKIGYRLKANFLLLHKLGFDIAGKIFDIEIAHYLIEPEISHQLSSLANQYLGAQLIESDQDPVACAIEQAQACLALKPFLEKELRERGHISLMSDTEMGLLPVLMRVEYEGVKIETTTLQEMSGVLAQENAALQQDIFALAGTTFNIASPKQLGDILFDKLKLVDKAKKTKSGQYATGEDILQKLANQHPIIDKILEFRENEKLRNTYLDSLPTMISAFDQRIHTEYRQAVAATGRLSSNNPNLQNIPIRTQKGRQIRKAFVPRNGEYCLLSADYSQIELRLAACFAQDATMLDAFRNGRDIHAATAAKVFKVALEEVTPDMRRKAKEVNFGILYGSSAFGLSQNLNISRAESSELIASYFTEFANIKKYMDDMIAFAREHQYVETILGRRRYLRDILSRNAAMRGFAERNAINAPIQGSAADVIKAAMINIDAWMQREKLKSRMVLQVHDELVFDVHKDELPHLQKVVPCLMKSAIALDVVLDVEVGVGDNWLDAH